uniref:Non-specific serine/threonine protein kinase n=1 Tax=Panagrolaimus sp. JU765 TaxID=591449 RepID=A0AC34QHP5_9BILA
MALELGGADLEHYNLEGEKKAISIFSQVALTLAVAEAEIEFEHRDLHWGNILIKSERQKKPLVYKYHGKTIELNHDGVSVRIIDFTLSRILKSNTMVGSDLNADEDLFKGEEGDLQFDTYRAMREVTRGKWERFSPKTNCLWLKYLGYMLMEKVKTGKGKLKPKRIEELTDFFNQVVDYDSAQDFVFNCESFKKLSKFAVIEC